MIAARQGMLRFYRRGGEKGRVFADLNARMRGDDLPLGIQHHHRADALDIITTCEASSPRPSHSYCKAHDPSVERSTTRSTSPCARPPEIQMHPTRP